MSLSHQPSITGTHENKSNRLDSIVVRCSSFEQVLADVRLIIIARTPNYTAAYIAPSGIGKTSREVALPALRGNSDSKLLTRNQENSRSGKDTKRYMESRSISQSQLVSVLSKIRLVRPAGSRQDESNCLAPRVFRRRSLVQALADVRLIMTARTQICAMRYVVPS
jgi:hypothetical protein